MAMRNMAVLIRHLRDLSLVCRVRASQDCRRVVILDVCLPPTGWNRTHTRMMIEGIPEDYPLSPPGLCGSRAFVESGLRFRGRKPLDYQEGHWFAGVNWALWCYRSIKGWDPRRDNLRTFLEMVRTDMTNPLI